MHFANFRGTMNRGYRLRAVNLVQLIEEIQLEASRLSGSIFRGNRSYTSSEKPTFDTITDMRETKQLFELVIQHLVAVELQRPREPIVSFHGAMWDYVIVPRWQYIELFDC